MKRLLRNVLTALAVTAAGGLTALAQTWTGNVPQAGDYYLYNVGSGKFLTSGNWWGTHAAVDDDGMLVKLIGSGNTYSISSAYAFGDNNYLGDDFYIDNKTAASWTFTEVSTGVYTMKTGDNYLVWTHGAVADGTTTAPTGSEGYWQIVSRNDLIENMKSATPSHPVDASFFMTNPKIRRNWTNSKPFQGENFNDNGSFNASAEGLYEGGCTSVGQWHKTFDNYQALTDLPNGKYSVTVKGFNRYDGDGANSPAYMYANSATVTLPTMGNIGTENAENATRALVGDTYLTDPVTTIVTDGNLRIGVKTDANCGWVTWREFTVKFISPALDFVADELPTSGSATADKWYAFSIPVANEYTLTSSVGTTVLYSQEGSKTTDADDFTTLTLTANTASDVIQLTTGTLYINCDADATLTIEATSYWPLFAETLALYAPYADVSAADDPTSYTTQYLTYQTYTEATSASLLRAAIDYMQTNYDDYRWENASYTHPIDVTEGIIAGAACTSNDAWPGSGRTTASGTYYDGTTRTYFTQNHESGPARSQSVTIPKAGVYLLRTIVRPETAASYATISIGDESTTTRGIPDAADNIGNGWTYNDIYFCTTAANTAKTISISLSNINASRAADCGEMHLLYIGQHADFVKDNIRRFIGTFATAPSIELTDDVPVAITAAATFTSGTATVTRTNPNGLVYAAEGQMGSSANVIVGGVCSSLQLADGHPFIAPESFTATSASYTLSALAGGEFATLVLPFAASAPSGTSIYVLDQDINVYAGTLLATPASVIEANQPVVVTSTGAYTGANVTVAAVAKDATYTGGQLVGTYSAMQAPKGSLVLQNQTAAEGVAFYYVGDTQPTVSPFRACLSPQSSSVKSVRVIFDESEATGITSVEHGSSNVDQESIYDLSGRRVQNAAKGLYIVNGKKVYVK